MRIRKPFAGAFLFLLLVSAYLGLSSLQISAVNDKFLHLVDFFLLTVCFYWVLDASRRRNLNLTLIVCTAILGLGSEFVQAFLPNGRAFDPYDILANIVGSLSALGLCSWYHKRMLERKRQAKHYHIVPGDEEGVDVELGEGAGLDSEEAGAAPSLEAEVDNWDENAEDAWDEDDHGGPENGEAEGQNGSDKTATVKNTTDS